MKVGKLLDLQSFHCSNTFLAQIPRTHSYMLQHQCHSFHSLPPEALLDILKTKKLFGTFIHKVMRKLLEMFLNLPFYFRNFISLLSLLCFDSVISIFNSRVMPVSFPVHCAQHAYHKG